jgi:sulfatase maturation enzyme AslB (radical SAM superfamily)
VTFDEVRCFEFEISRLCNARCPLCTRTEILDNPKMEDFTQDYISLEQIKRVFDGYDLKNKHFRFNGAVGDPMTNPDIIPILEYLHGQSSGNNTFEIHTNGGLRNTKFWEDMGALTQRVKEKNSVMRVTFAIDGLEDTNHIYRVGVNYKEVINNLKTFIVTGGTAVWAFIVFNHNQHQLEDARAYARALGCSNFITVKAFRNIINDIDIKQGGKHNFDDKTIAEYTKIRQQLAKRNMLEMIVPPQPKEEKTDYTDDIKCFNVHDKTVYIMGGLTVWPCCMFYDDLLRKKPQWLESLKQYGPHFNDLNHKTLKEILEGEFMTTIEQRWNMANPTFTPACVKHCAGKGKFLHKNREWENL